MSRKSPEPCYIFNNVGGSVSFLNFCRVDNTQRLFVCTTEGEFSIWDPVTKRRLNELKVDKQILACGNLNDSIWIALRAYSVQIYTPDLRKKLINIEMKHQGFCKPLTFESFLVIPLEGETPGPIFEVFKVTKPDEHSVTMESVTKVHSSREKLGMLMCLEYVPKKTDMGHIIAGFESGAMTIYSTKDWSETFFFQPDHPEPIFNLTCSQKLRLVATGSGRGQSLLFRVNEDGTMEEARPASAHARAGSVCALALRADSRLLACGCADGRVRIFSTKSAKLLALLEFHSERVDSLAFCQEKINQEWILAVGSADGRISLWNIYND